MVARSASQAGGFTPAEGPRVAAAVDGSVAAIYEAARVTVLELPAGAAFAEIGVDPDAVTNDVAWLGTPPRLLVVSRYASYSTAHLLDPYGLRTISEIRLGAPMRLVATVGAMALVVGPQSAVVILAGEAHLAWYPVPSRTLPAAAGAAGNHFVVAMPSVIEQWDPQTRQPSRRLKLPRVAAITAVGGSDRLVWMIAQQAPSRLEVIPIVNRGQPRAHELPEPIASVAGHPRSDTVVCLGAETGRLYVLDLDGRTRTRILTPDGLERVDAAALIVGRGAAVLAAQSGLAPVLVPLDPRGGSAAPPPLVVAVPVARTGRLAARASDERRVYEQASGGDAAAAADDALDAEPPVFEPLDAPTEANDAQEPGGLSWQLAEPASSASAAPTRSVSLARPTIAAAPPESLARTVPRAAASPVGSSTGERFSAWRELVRNDRKSPPASAPSDAEPTATGAKPTVPEAAPAAARASASASSSLSRLASARAPLSAPPSPAVASLRAGSQAPLSRPPEATSSPQLPAAALSSIESETQPAAGDARARRAAGVPRLALSATEVAVAPASESGAPPADGAGQRPDTEVVLIFDVSRDAPAPNLGSVDAETLVLDVPRAAGQPFASTDAGDDSAAIAVAWSPVLANAEADQVAMPEDAAGVLRSTQQSPELATATSTPRAAPAAWSSELADAAAEHAASPGEASATAGVQQSGGLAAAPESSTAASSSELADTDVEQAASREEAPATKGVARNSQESPGPADAPAPALAAVVAWSSGPTHVDPATPVAAGDALWEPSTALSGFAPAQRSATAAPLAAPPHDDAWRDEVVAWSRAVAAGPADLGAPAAPAIDALIARFELSSALRPVLTLLYGAHLCGERGAAPVEVARLLDRSWDEALGRGELAARGIAEYAASRVALVPALLRFLDELPPLTGVLVGEPGPVALLGPCVLVAGDEPLVELAARCSLQLAGAILAAQGEPDRAALVFEARAHGAAAMLRAALTEPPSDAAIYVVRDPELADRFGLPQLA